MDPIKSGTVIFKKLAEEFGSERISDLDKIKKFFTRLIAETEGWVIVDFLDTANWDKIENFEINDDNDLLTLVWHDYRGIEESIEDKEMRQIVFPASLYAIAISVNSIVLIIGNQLAVFLINGYAKTEKQIKSLYKREASEFKIYDDSFFKKQIVRKINNEWEVIDFHCTPIYSLAIIPKNSGFTSFDSKKILYQFNINEALKRISSVVEVLNHLDGNDYDLICEKTNTARRVLESVLKIECCYRDIELKGNYSQILLGPLSNYIKRVKDEEFKLLLNKMVELLNEFSHDSGKPIELEKAKTACMLVMAYTKLYQIEMNLPTAPTELHSTQTSLRSVFVPFRSVSAVGYLRGIFF